MNFQTKRNLKLGPPLPVEITGEAVSQADADPLQLLRMDQAVVGELLDSLFYRLKNMTLLNT
jgi:hypothetical protein